MRERKMRFNVQAAKVAALLVCVICVLCAACGNAASATTMKLVRMEGKVSVCDEKEKELTLIEDMNLYSGYRLETEKAAYSWIDLDSVKLAKMDQESDIEIQKSGKNLEILLNSGSLFFHVTEPLKEDETMSIRTSTMAVGIRGTCGWVSVPEEEQMYVYILEGTVECSITNPNTGEVLAKAVTEGEWARLVWKDGKAEIIVEKFTKEEIPPFVLEEIEKDSGLAEQIEKSLAANAEAADDGTEGNSDDILGTEEGSGEDSDLVIIKTNINELEYVNGNGAGNVIVTVRDGLYGAVNLSGDEIVPNIYSSYVRTPNNEGQFILGDGENAVVFDNRGNVIWEVPQVISIHISENAVTYSNRNSEGAVEVCCYDIAEGRLTAQIEMENERNLSAGADSEARVTCLQGGEFWYSYIDYLSYNTDEFYIYLVRKDGSVVWSSESLVAERREAWKEEMLAAGKTVVETEEGLYAYSSVNGMGGEAFFLYDSGYPIQSPKDGYMICVPCLDADSWRIYDCNGRSSIRFNIYDLDGTWDLFPSADYWPRSYYDEGQWFVNRGLQTVIQGYQYDSDETIDYLIDFSVAQTDEDGNVTNLQDLVLAQYPYIILAGDGYYAASDGEKWFYLNERGERIGSYEWADGSSFYGGYALVLEDDGMAYMVDKNFDKVTEGFPADSVYQAGGLFCVSNGDEQTFIYIANQ